MKNPFLISAWSYASISSQRLTVMKRRILHRISPNRNWMNNSLTVDLLLLGANHLVVIPAEGVLVHDVVFVALRWCGVVREVVQWVPSGRTTTYLLEVETATDTREAGLEMNSIEERFCTFLPCSTIEECTHNCFSVYFLHIFANSSGG